MRFLCEIGNCKRNKQPSEFADFSDLLDHVNGNKYAHGYTKREVNMLQATRRMRKRGASKEAVAVMKNAFEKKR